MVRTDSYQNQLKLNELLSSQLINDVVIALNLAPTTPKWLVDIGANPMKLGLDLRGGVHFLMQVDTETALRNRQDGTLQDLRIRFRDICSARLSFSKISREYQNFQACYTAKAKVYGTL